MTADSVFSIVNLVAAAAWVVLAVAPYRRWSNTVVTTGIAVLLAAVYVVVVATHWADSEGGFSTLTGVATLFANRWLLLAGWIHYLVFDLLIGSWEARDASRRSIPHLLLLPCLALTLLFGPAGWLLYMGLRSTMKPTRVAADL